MSAIGIVDDRLDYRESLKKKIGLTLRKLKINTWQVTETRPLDEVIDYNSWIAENEISVLIIDERLYEAGSNNSQVNYNGHHLVDHLRSHLLTLPIFLVSSFDVDEDVEERFKDVEEIVKKDILQKKIEAYVIKFIRAGQNFTKSFEQDLDELSENAEKVVMGKATKQDIDRLNAIRTKLQLSFPLKTLDEKGKEMNALNRNIKKLENIKKKIEKRLRNK